MDYTVIGTLAVLIIVVVTTLAPRVGVAAPLLLVLVGVAISFLPFVPAIEIESEWVLAGILPPLLYSAAVNVPTMDFRRDFSTISSLSVVLVVVSAVVVGAVMAALIPGIGLATGIALGAIVSPTDAVATSVVRKAGVSPRLVTMLEGESMLNDASALVLLRSAVAATAGAVSLWGVAGDFVYAVLLAVVIGFVVGHLNLFVRRVVAQATAGVAISFVVPFVAFLPAEHLGASGLVAAVTAGLVSGHGAPRHLRAADRLNERAVWQTIELLLESGVFLLMGLELSGLVEDVRDEHGSLVDAAVFGAVAALVVIAIRTAFVAVSVWGLARRAKRGPRVRERLEEFRDTLDQGRVPSRRGPGTEPSRGRSARAYAERMRRASKRTTQRISDIDYLTAEAIGWREGAVLVWAGMRGAVTLAAAQSLPEDTPQRSTIVLVAFVVAGGTLLVQGGTLMRLVRLLGLTGRATDAGSEHRELRAALEAAARNRLADPELRRPDGDPYAEGVRALADRAVARKDDDEIDPGAPGEMSDLMVELLAAQREALLEIRDLGAYSSAALDNALRILDAQEVGIEIRNAATPD
ncbi:sodium:proton antiporter [Aldersonia sp. NBC_00410]|uniref:cation:proton antiporter n=1 Tax=Aldersonia sp. NBC_00410 TaxID=2975954 RepID=UPI00224CD6BE|nr:sodium:proton antiporter [Aldersonia sp. NBC_00410]MCX5044945.1 sodium:proton antiporter [Aldersonia sp. NBC_00410]